MKDKDIFKELGKVKRLTWRSVNEAFTKSDEKLVDHYKDEIGKLDIVCSNCGAEYVESIRICESCGIDMVNPIVDKYNELLEDMRKEGAFIPDLRKSTTQKVRDKYMQGMGKGYKSVSRRVRY